MNVLFPGLPLQNVTRLSLTDIRPSRPQPEGQGDAPLLFALFRQLPSVEILSISRHLARDLPKVLAPLGEGPLRNRQTLPHLKVLNVGPSLSEYRGSYKPDLSEILLLIDSLHARAATGHVLDILRIPDSYVDFRSKDRVEKLKGCASAVHLSYRQKADVVLGA